MSEQKPLTKEREAEIELIVNSFIWDVMKTEAVMSAFLDIRRDRNYWRSLAQGGLAVAIEDRRCKCGCVWFDITCRAYGERRGLDLLCPLCGETLEENGVNTATVKLKQRVVELENALCVAQGEREKGLANDRS